MRTTRERLGYTLRQVEEISGVSNAYLSLIESGKRESPHPNILRKLAQTYDLNPEYLFKLAGYLDIPPAEKEDIEIETLFNEARLDKSVQFGSRLRGDLDPGSKKVIAMMYKELKLKRQQAGE